MAPQETSRYAALTRPRSASATAVWRRLTAWTLATPMPRPMTRKTPHSSTGAAAPTAAGRQHPQRRPVADDERDEQHPAVPEAGRHPRAEPGADERADAAGGEHRADHGRPQLASRTA